MVRFLRAMLICDISSWSWGNWRLVPDLSSAVVVFAIGSPRSRGQQAHNVPQTFDVLLPFFKESRFKARSLAEWIL